MLQRALTFFLVIVGWVLFRADNLTMALGLLEKMLAFQAGPAMACLSTAIVAVALAAVVAHAGKNTFEIRHEWKPAQTLAWGGLFALCLFTIYGGHRSPFLYFQF